MLLSAASMSYKDVDTQELKLCVVIPLLKNKTVGQIGQCFRHVCLSLDPCLHCEKVCLFAH